MIVLLGLLILLLVWIDHLSLINIQEAIIILTFLLYGLDIGQEGSQNEHYRVTWYNRFKYLLIFRH